MQRIEVITGKERRRYWSDADKLRIVAEADMPGVTQKEVARRNDVHPNQIYIWRKAFQKNGKKNSSNDTTFLPVELVPDQKTEPVSPDEPLEVVLKNDRVIRIGKGFDEDTLKRVLAVLEAV